MKVKELKNLLENADETLEVLVLNSDNVLQITTYFDSGESTFTGACDKNGELLDNNDEKGDIKTFIIAILK